MKKKLFSLVLLIIMMVSALFIFAGCGSDTKGSNKNDADAGENGAGGSKIESVVNEYVKSLRENCDSEKAYKYIDYVGVAAWQSLNYPIGYEISEKEAKKFAEKYKEFSNDSEIVSKINDYAKNKFTSDYYEYLNDDVKSGSNKHKIIDTKELTDGLYSVKVKYYKDSADGTSDGYETVYVLTKKNDEYYFVDANSLYLPSRADFTKALK